MHKTNYTRIQNAAFHPEISVLPITALCSVPQSSLVLAGRGSSICLYDAKEGRCLWQHKVFKRANVHGIILSDILPNVAVVLVWGSRFVNVMKIIDLRGIKSEGQISFSGPSGGRSNQAQTYIGNPIVCSDWIMDCSFRPQTSEVRCSILGAAAVTAHNALIYLNIDLGDCVGDQKMMRSDE